MSPEGAAKPKRSDRAPVERQILAAVAVLAVLALCAAFALNWFLSPAGAPEQVAVELGMPVKYQPDVLHLDQPAVELLPQQILAYETITRQPIPGQGDQAAEAIYVTLNMDLTAQRPTNVYARVEGFADEGEAARRLDDMMAPYPTKAANGLASGVTVTRTGYALDEGAYAQGWTYGQYAVFVKTSFIDFVIPAQKRQILATQSQIVVDAIDLFQRTGAQGIQAGAAEATSTP